MENLRENLSNTGIDENKKGDFLFRFSIGLFIAVLVATGSLYFYKLNIESSLEDANSQISNTEKSIGDLKKDKLLQIYNLYTMNKTKIDNDLKKSNINSYVNYLRLTASKYGLQFSGFNYDTKKLSTALASTTDTNLGYLKLVKFIRDYRTTTNDLVDLGFISSINGSDKITTNIEFSIK